MIRLAFIMLLLIALPAAAEGVRVPPECETLRRHEGLPRVLTNDQVEEQWQRLNRYLSDPRLVECRNAVARLRSRLR